MALKQPFEKRDNVKNAVLSIRIGDNAHFSTNPFLSTEFNVEACQITQVLGTFCSQHDIVKYVGAVGD